MYTFYIKDNGPDITMVVTRSLLALSAIASLLYRTDNYFYLNIIAAAVLTLAAIFVNTLVTRYHTGTRFLLYVSAIVLFIATHAVAFAIIPLAGGILIKKIYREPVINVNTQGIIIKKMFGNQVHTWEEFNNIILKDNLLTLDFKDNKLLQLNIINKGTEVDESSFNNFCSGFIGI